jgi:uncharacterized membrane protein YgdD (TMEM256/DUF423 family)
MSRIAQRWIAIGALLGAIGVALGAIGAHGLNDFLARQGFSGDDLHRRAGMFDTAVRYQMLHAIALVLTGLALQQHDCKCWRFAAWAFLVGIILFCGLLKALVFLDSKWYWLAHVVPFGGGAMIAGWLGLAIGALRISSPQPPPQSS